MLQNNPASKAGEAARSDYKRAQTSVCNRMLFQRIETMFPRPHAASIAVMANAAMLAAIRIAQSPVVTGQARSSRSFES